MDPFLNNLGHLLDDFRSTKDFVHIAHMQHVNNPSFQDDKLMAVEAAPAELFVPPVLEPLVDNRGIGW